MALPYWKGMQLQKQERGQRRARTGPGGAERFRAVGGIPDGREL